MRSGYGAETIVKTGDVTDLDLALQGYGYVERDSNPWIGASTYEFLYSFLLLAYNSVKECGDNQDKIRGLVDYFIEHACCSLSTREFAKNYAVQVKARGNPSLIPKHILMACRESERTLSDEVCNEIINMDEGVFNAFVVYIAENMDKIASRPDFCYPIARRAFDRRDRRSVKLYELLDIMRLSLKCSCEMF